MGFQYVFQLLSSEGIVYPKTDPSVFPPCGLFRLRHAGPKGFTLTNGGFTDGYGCGRSR